MNEEKIRQWILNASYHELNHHHQYHYFTDPLFKVESLRTLYLDTMQARKEARERSIKRAREWVKHASYADLMDKYHFAPWDDPVFNIGENERFFFETLEKREKERGHIRTLASDHYHVRSR